MRVRGGLCPPCTLPPTPSVSKFEDLVSMQQTVDQTLTFSYCPSQVDAANGRLREREEGLLRAQSKCCALENIKHVLVSQADKAQEVGL